MNIRNIKFLKLKLVSLLLIIIIILFFPHFFRNNYAVTISNKQKINNMYYIYAETSDGTIKIFKDYNSAVELKFNCEDIYMALRVGESYEIHTYGIGMPLISSYENITRVRGITGQ